MAGRLVNRSLASPETYVSRPVTVTAMQWRGDNYLGLREFLVHNLGATVHVTIRGDAVHFVPRENLVVQLALNEVIMFTVGEQRPHFRIVTERAFHASFKLTGEP